MAQTIVEVNTGTDTFQTWIDRTNECINAISNEVVTANNNANGALTTGNTQIIGSFTANVIAAYNEIRGGNVQTAALLTISSNVIISTGNNFTVGNSTANAYLTATDYSMGSATVNLAANSTTLLISNSTVTTTLNKLGLTLANSTVSFAIIKPTVTQNNSGRHVLNANGSFTTVPLISTSTTTGTSAQVIDSWLKASFRSADYFISVVDDAANAYHATKMMVVHDDSATAVHYNEYGSLISNTTLGTFSANANTTHALIQFTPTPAATTVTITKTLVDI